MNTVPTAYNTVCTNLQQNPKTWLVTGGARFIGSNLVETLLNLGQHVIGFDNYSTGHSQNIDAALKNSTGDFTFIFGDITNTNEVKMSSNLMM